MTHKQRDWARKHWWFYCSDSKAIWTKVGEKVAKFTSMRDLRAWAEQTTKE